MRTRRPSLRLAFGLLVLTGVGAAIVGSASARTHSTGVVAITSVTSTSPNGTYVPGQVIRIVVVFASGVSVTGTPRLQLATAGSVNEIVNYTSGTETSALNFDYTVQPGDSSADLDYLSVNALTLNGGQIVGADDTSTASDLTLPAKGSANSLAGTKNIVVKPSGTASSTEASSGSGGSSTSGSTSSSSGSSAAKPSAPSFTPASGKAGTKVTLTGTNYKGATAVTFNGTKAKFTVSSATKIVATVPVGAKTGKIAVTTAGGTATSAKSFTVR